MSTRKITVKSRYGRPVIETSGFEGDSCFAATAGIERALAGDGGVEILEFNPSQGVEQENLETN